MVNWDLDLNIDIRDDDIAMQEFVRNWFKYLMENSTLFDNFTTGAQNSTYDRPSTLPEVLQKLAPAVITVDRVISPIWYVIGLICNPIATKIWLSRRFRKNNSSAIYVGTLAFVHTVFLCLHIILELNYAWDIQTYDRKVLCEFFNVLIMLPQYFSPLLVLAFTVERYIAVNHPFKKEKFCTVRRAIYVSVSLGYFSLALSSLQAYIWMYDPESQKCVYLGRPEASQFEKYWTLLTETLIFLIVPVCVLIFNILVIKEIRRLTTKGPVVSLRTQTSGSGSGSPTSTVTLLSVSFYLICTLLPASVVYSLQALLPQGGDDMTYTEMANDPTWQRYLRYLTIRKIVEEVCLSNYACYFFIYCITGQYFRQEVKRMFTVKSCRKRRNSMSSPSKRSEYTLVTTNGKLAKDCAATPM